MSSDENIRELAYFIWEQEGCPDGKDSEHYFRAKKIMEARESVQIIQIAEEPEAAGSASSELEMETPPEQTSRKPTTRKKSTPRKPRTKKASQ